MRLDLFCPGFVGLLERSRSVLTRTLVLRTPAGGSAPRRPPRLDKKSLRRKLSGFTLLEVMIAITIMTLAFGSIYESQSQSLILVTKTKEQNLAGWLAHNKMVESEHMYEGKSFDELPKSAETEKFKAPFENYAWKREVKEVKFPDLPLASGKPGEGVPEPVRLLAKTLTKYLGTSLRELVVTVTWHRGDGEYNVTLSTYLVDLNAQLDWSI